MVGSNGGVLLLLKTTSRTDLISISPVASFGLTFSERLITSPSTWITSSLRSARAIRLHLFVVREIEDDLGDAVAVAEIDEDQSTMVTVILDPATECYGLSDVIGSKFAAGVGTQHGGAVGYWRGNARCGHGATIIEVAGCAAKGG